MSKPESTTKDTAGSGGASGGAAADANRPNDPPASSNANDAATHAAKADAFLPPPAQQPPMGAPTFVVRIPLTTRKKALLSQLFDSAGEMLKDYMPYDQGWPARTVKGGWLHKPRISIPLLPPRAVIVSSKLIEVLGELDKFIKKKAGLSLNFLPQKDLKSSQCIIALCCFSILANILVSERDRPNLIQVLSNYLAFTQAIQRQILEEIIDLHPVEVAVKTVTRRAFDPKSLSVLAILTSLEREAKKRQAEMYAKLANQLFPPIDEIKVCLKRIARLLFSVFVVAQHDEIPDDDLLNRLFDPNPTFINQRMHDETAGLDEDSSQKLAAEMKRDGNAYILLVEKREEISRKLSQANNVHVLEWAEQQTFTRFIGFNNFIQKVVRAAKAKPTEKPIYTVFMHAFENCTSLYLSTSILEQVVDKFDTAVSQLANLTAHVASAPIAACTEALAALKRRLDNFAANLTSQCSEAYGMARRSITLDLVGLSVAVDVDNLTQKQAAQLLRLESLGEVVATPIYLLKILKVKDLCGQVRTEAAKLIPYVTKLREAADVITALENILGIISNVKEFNTVTSNAVGKPLPLDIEPLEVLKRKLAARAPIVNGLRQLERQANNLHSTYMAADPYPSDTEVKEEKVDDRLLQREGSSDLAPHLSGLFTSHSPAHSSVSAGDAPVPPIPGSSFESLHAHVSSRPPPLPPRSSAVTLLQQQLHQQQQGSPPSARQPGASPFEPVSRSSTVRILAGAGSEHRGSPIHDRGMISSHRDSPSPPPTTTSTSPETATYGGTTFPGPQLTRAGSDSDDLSEGSDESSITESIRRLSDQHSNKAHPSQHPGAIQGDGCAAQCEQHCSLM